MCALKKPDSSGFSNLTERFMHDAAHLTLMGLIGAEDVEILQANDTIQPAVTFCVNIKKMLRVAIHVQRPQSVEIFISILHACRSVPIGCCRRGINKSFAAVQRPFSELARILVVVLDEVAAVCFRCVRASAHMKNDTYPIKAWCIEDLDQAIMFEIVLETKVC